MFIFSLLPLLFDGYVLIEPEFAHDGPIWKYAPDGSAQTHLATHSDSGFT